VRDPLGRTTSYTYDLAGNQLSTTDASGVVTTFAYDPEGNMVQSVADSGGLNATTANEYDAGGRLTKAIGPLLHETTYTYDNANRLITVTSHLGNATNYAYDAVGRQTSVTSGGRTRSTVYNNAGWVTQVSDGSTVTDYLYDEVGNRICVTVSGRAPVYSFYDDANRLCRTEQTDASDPLNPVTIVTTRTLDASGRVTASTDGEGKTTGYVYDGANRVTSVTNPAGEATTYTYDGAGRRTSVAFANGSSRTYVHDAAGQLTSGSGGPEGTLTYGYDASGRQTTVTDANGRTREADYDALGRVTEARNEMSQPVTYAYDIADRRTSLTDANGNTTTYDHDEDNRLVTMTYPAVAGEPTDAETYLYDSSGLLTSKVTPNGDTIGYSYDGAGRLASLSFGGRTVGYARDGAGAVTGIGNVGVGMGDLTTVGYSYDLLGRMTSSSDSALGKTVDYTSDLRGLRTGLALDGTTVTYGYDNAGRLETVQKTGEAQTAVYVYDGGGRRDSLTLPNGASTSYSYDGSDRLLALTTAGPGGTLASFTYTLDDTGNRDGITYADGSTSTYEYDNAYRLTKETRTKEGGTGVSYEITYEYDDVGNRIRMTSTGSAKPYRADSDTGGLWHMDDPVEEGAITVVDASGNENHLVGGSGIESVEGRLGQAVRFDGLNGLLSCLDDVTNAALELGSDDFTLELWVMPEALTGTCQLAAKWDETADARSWRLYLNDGIPTLDLSTDGTLGTVHTLVGTEALVVDEWAQIVASRSAGTVKLSVDGTEVASMTDPGTAHDGAADLKVGEGLIGAIDEMRLSTSDRVAADAVGKVEVDYTYNARNQLVTEASGTSVNAYSYCNNGNVIEIKETVGAVEVSREEMTYDELNRMRKHRGPRGEEVFTYRGAEWHRYSADGTSFLYDGDNVLTDISGGATSAFYVTPFLDQNLSMTKAGCTYYYSHDGLGSVRTLTDSGGAVVNRYGYLPFGGAYAPRTSVAVQQRYTYTGRERNPASDFMYYRYRQYDPRVGRFGGRDPGSQGVHGDSTYVYGNLLIDKPYGGYRHIDKYHFLVSGKKKGKTKAQIAKERKAVADFVAKFIKTKFDEGCEKAKKGECKEGLKLFGMALHAAQDKYAHSIHRLARDPLYYKDEHKPWDVDDDKSSADPKRKPKPAPDFMNAITGAQRETDRQMKKFKDECMGCCCDFPRLPKQPAGTKSLCEKKKKKKQSCDK
jgi:RHS repeat-associated protein